MLFLGRRVAELEMHLLICKVSTTLSLKVVHLSRKQRKWGCYPPFCCSFPFHSSSFFFISPIILPLRRNYPPPPLTPLSPLSSSSSFSSYSSVPIILLLSLVLLLLLLRPHYPPPLPPPLTPVSPLPSSTLAFPSSSFSSSTLASPSSFSSSSYSSVPIILLHLSLLLLLLFRLLSSSFPLFLLVISLYYSYFRDFDWSITTIH